MISGNSSQPLLRYLSNTNGRFICALQVVMQCCLSCPSSISSIRADVLPLLLLYEEHPSQCVAYCLVACLFYGCISRDVPNGMFSLLQRHLLPILLRKDAKHDVLSASAFCLHAFLSTQQSTSPLTEKQNNASSDENEEQVFYRATLKATVIVIHHLASNSHGNSCDRLRLRCEHMSFEKRRFECIGGCKLAASCYWLYCARVHISP